VAGVGLIRVYKIGETQFILKEECRIKDQVFTALVYTSSIFGN